MLSFIPGGEIDQLIGGCELNAKTILSIIMIFALTSAGGAVSAQHGTMASDIGPAEYWVPTENAMGMAGTLYGNDTLSFDVPSGLNVTVDGIRLAPGADLSHEIHFMRMGDYAMIMGELVITENEVKNATQQLIRAGFDETALHDHLIRETPPVLYMHFHGYGDPAEMAGRIRGVIDVLNSQNAPAGSVTAADVSVFTDVAGPKLDTILGAKGQSDGGVYSYSIPRADNITDNGTVLTPRMDISEEIAFQPIDTATAALIGELALEANEVDPVIRALSDSGIEVTAVHSHMLTEEPRLFYLHCWAVGDPETLARGMRAALDRVNCLTGTQ